MRKCAHCNRLIMPRSSGQWEHVSRNGYVHCHRPDLAGAGFPNAFTATGVVATPLFVIREDPEIEVLLAHDASHDAGHATHATHDT